MSKASEIGPDAATGLVPDPRVAVARLAGRLFASHGALRGRHLLVLDVLASALVILAAIAIREDALPGDVTLAGYLPIALLPIVIRPLLWMTFGLYRRLWLYASVPELIQIAEATIAGSLVTVVAAGSVIVLRPDLPVPPRSFWIIEGILSLAAVGGLRFTIRALSDWRRGVLASRSTTHRVPTLLFGAGEAGTLVARSAMRQPKAGLRPVGFLDDDPSRRGDTAAGLQVFGGIEALERAATVTGARRVLITMPSAPGTTIRRVTEAALALGLEVRTVPPLHELIDGSIDAFRARHVKVEDLLGRAMSSEHSPAVAHLLRDRTVMVTGAGGSIGSELARQVYATGCRRLILVDRAESPLYEIQRDLELRRSRNKADGEIVVALANVVSRHLMTRLMTETKPDVVFHAAAYKHVPMMEEYPSESVQVNIGGTLSVIDAALAAGVERFVLVSTDKAVEPTSVMGATKRVAEALVFDAARSTGRPYIAVRFGNVLGSAGSVVPIFMGQLERGEALTVTHPEMTRYFMTIAEAGWLILDAAALGRSGDLFVLDMGEPVRILDLVEDLIRLSGRAPESVPIEYTGLRPGEKLHERLFYADEAVEPTEVPKVRRASATMPPTDIRHLAAGLLGTALTAPDESVRAELFALISTLNAPGASHSVGGHPVRRSARASKSPVTETA
ncbi:MAG TPA: nucleoside-diphosphate sugar epimerase/dehydratase [Candidatus Limnocylindrales bacterium]|nr:nucleoside-diphosphate sugar epimerase/dehydratase [Candidatus Limnocylindrales bacterium]